MRTRHEYQRDASLQYSGETLTNDTEAKQKATEAVLAALSKVGIEVVRATDEEVKVLLSNSHAPHCAPHKAQFMVGRLMVKFILQKQE